VALVSCDLIGMRRDLTARIRRLVSEATGLPPEALLVHCTHTHSGPCTGPYIGWGEPDQPYLEILPTRVAEACIQALRGLQPATLAHAEVPCEGIGQNREYDKDALPLDQVLDEQWRPAKPELTDTTCHVLRVESEGRVIGFASYFGCHPVVCCEATRYIHGDCCGVATNLLEREHPGAVGLFLQGAQGDVNSCVVHKPEPESLLALDLIAGRYTRAVRQGLAEARPLAVDRIGTARREVVFRRKPWDAAKVRSLLAEQEAKLQAPGATDSNRELRMATVYAVALRGILAAMEAGRPVEPSTEVQGLRIGPLLLLGSPFETFQAIKRDVQAQAGVPRTLVLSFCNDSVGYAVDRTTAARGGYAADMVPLICGSLPFADVHTELVAALLDLARMLAE
jgi:hypothetical protein